MISLCDIKVVSKNVTPELIPHNKFHKGIWLLPVRHSDWYYFLEKENGNSIHNKTFIESVDPPLRELVEFLHSKNIRTTPSCSGHHMHEKNFEKIYSSLEKHAEEINGEGLELKDIESGKTYLFQSKNYFLPWTKNEFVSEVMQYQKKGVLGIRLKNGAVKEEILNMDIDGVTTEEKDSILFIYADDEHGYNSGKWKKVTNKVKEIFLNDKILKNVHEAELFQ